MRASRETARAAQAQSGQVVEVLRREIERCGGALSNPRLDAAIKLHGDISKFLEAAERVLPAEADYEGKAAKRDKREPVPAA